MPVIDCPFTEAEMLAAHKEWGCNCGPSALAFALQVGLDLVRGAIPGFEKKGHTSPTMMKAALTNLGKRVIVRPSDVESMFEPNAICLVRLQWTGPWTQPLANPKWAYRASHWIAAWREQEEVFNATGRFRIGTAHRDLVFDGNGGMSTFDAWKREIVPAITASIPRADGKWFPTHVWRLP